MLKSVLQHVTQFIQDFVLKRYVVTFFLFIGITLFSAIAGTFSVAVVAMENSGAFNWSPEQKGIILSGLYYGFLVTQIPSGILVRHFPANIIFGVGIVGACCLTWLTPFVARNFELLITFKVIEGLFLGFIYPAMITLVKNWAPPLERTRIMLFIAAGNYFGPVISMPVAGLLADKFGWESVFYSIGLIGVIWFTIYMTIIRESPEKDTLISNHEREFILSQLDSHINDKSPIPWKSIFSSVPFLGIVIANLTLSWGLYTITTQLPSYLMDMNPELALKMTGFYSMLPALTAGIFSPISGSLVDFILKRDLITLKQVRRYFTCLAFIFQSIFLLLTAFIMNSYVTIAFLSMSEGLAAFALCGCGVNYLDIAPQFSGLLLSISISVGTLAGIASPLLAGFIVQNKQEDEWRIVFFIAAGIYLIGSFLYWFMASGELQSWAKIEGNKDKKRENV